MNISRIKSQLDSWATRRSRLLCCHSEFSGDGYLKKTLTKNQKLTIHDFWKPYCRLSKDSWNRFEFYNAITDNPEILKYYIPECIYYSLIDSFFTKVRHCEAISDKNLFDFFFYDVKQPATVCHKQGDLLLDSNYNIITPDEAYDAIRKSENVIIKPSRDSNGGSGIQFISPNGNDEEIYKVFSGKSFVAQRVISQHKALASIHKQSINTIRIITFLNDDKVIPLSSVLRIGTGNAKVDNAHNGGIVCGIMSDGHLKDHAYNLHGAKYDKHPDSNISFKEIKIPAFEQCIKLVCRLAPRLAEFTKLISWDLSVNEEGEPVLIEANLTYGGVSVHQLCNGPIFGQDTPHILKEVFIKK